jgi:hypothetical protein
MAASQGLSERVRLSRCLTEDLPSSTTESGAGVVQAAYLTASEMTLVLQVRPPSVVRYLTRLV